MVARSASILTRKETKGKMKQLWGKLTDDDFKVIESNHQEIFGKLQKHYGYTRVC